MYVERKSKMCYEDHEYLQRDDYSSSYESNNTGGKTKVTRYADGTSTYHFGGPCGSVNYDSNGEEC